MLEQTPKRKYWNAWYASHKAKAACTDCKNLYPYYVMDFDHLYNKEFNIANFRTWNRKVW